MYIKKVFVLAMSLSLGASLLFGADFWIKKKYVDWTQKEVQQMLKNSPWAHPIDMRTGSMSSMGGGRGSGGGRRGGGGMGGGSLGDASGASGAGGGQESGGGGAGGAQMVPSVTVIIRWDSALPVRHAIARSILDASGGMSPDAGKLLESQGTQYVISISGVPMRMLRGAPNQPEPVALLKVKGKDAVKAESIKASRDQANAVLYLFFPRTSPIILEDQEVEVAFKAGSVDVKRKFKLKDMVYEGKLEL